MRTRDPRRLLGRPTPASVRIVSEADPPIPPEGSVATRQVAEVTLPGTELERLWTPEYLERLGRTYWRFLTRVSLGLLRVLYGPSTREVVLLARPFVLLCFRAPEYSTESCRASVTWRIERGLLVAPPGRGKGYLRLTVERPPGRPPDHDPEGSVTVRVSSEVANFYPTIAGWGWFSRLGRLLYRATQLPLHLLVTHSFLRSLRRLDLPESVVGALRAKDG